FIKDIIIQSDHPIVEITLGEDYWLTELSSESISETILKKEEKIDFYKVSKGIEKCWLLIVIDGASSASSFNILLEKMPRNLVAFDRVYIFDNFKGEIIQGLKN